MTRATLPDPQLCGDDLISLRVDDVAAAQRLARVLRGNPAWLEVVPGMDSVVVQFDPTVVRADDALATLRVVEVPREVLPATAGKLLRIPVHYGGDHGPDLGAVCRTLGIGREDFIRLHTQCVHHVELLGFTPGFAYLGGLDSRLQVARLPQPRQRVDAGSIGIAAGYTGLYALPGPGGWPLIGRTSLPLFDAGQDEPFRLQAGQRVRFEAAGADVP
jgi:KipI family sensor histidine kinase inhibitor